MPPLQQPGKSKQDYQTPKEVVDAVRHRLGIWSFDWDLAASDENAVAVEYFTEEDDSLTKDWSILKGWCWLNPPYAHITPWVKKAWTESQLGAHIAMLLPLSGGSNWWRDWVHNKAHVLMMNGRIRFVGAKDLYPKDTSLLLYTPYIQGGYDIWNWRPNKPVPKPL